MQQPIGLSMPGPLRPPRHRPQWRRAFNALRGLLADPDRTELAVEVSLALDGSLLPRTLARLMAHPEGRRLYEERPSLADALGDRARLEQLPDESFGRAYLAYLDRHALDPAKLIGLARRAARETGETEPGLLWAIERGQIRHDLFHVLTGYGADKAGESALLPFSLAQLGGRANALLTLGASWRMLRERGLGWIPYAWRAWQRGRRAVSLVAVPYEELLPLPLDDVRRMLQIEPPEQAHAGGVLRDDALLPTG